MVRPVAVFAYHAVWGAVGLCIAVWSAKNALSGQHAFWFPFAIASLVLLKVVGELRLLWRYHFLRGPR